MRDTRRFQAPRLPLAPPAQADDDAHAVTTDQLARARALVAQAAQAAPPARELPDPGDVCARLPRADGTELHVAVREYEGRTFVGISVWQNAWPVKGRAVTVRPRELAQVIEGLCLAAERLR